MPKETYISPITEVLMLQTESAMTTTSTESINWGGDYNDTES